MRLISISTRRRPRTVIIAKLSADVLKLLLKGNMCNKLQVWKALAQRKTARSKLRRLYMNQIGIKAKYISVDAVRLIEAIGSYIVVIVINKYCKIVYFIKSDTEKSPTKKDLINEKKIFFFFLNIFK